jgi:hypothetical protein
MNRLLFAATLAAFTTAAFAADNQHHARIGQPDYYGRLDFNIYPHPKVINRHPVAIERVSKDRPPVYLRVPAGQTKHWRRYCRKYNACGERVFFVRDNWYNREYVPWYQEHYRDRRDAHANEHRDDHHDVHGDDHHGNQNDYRNNNHSDARDH